MTEINRLAQKQENAVYELFNTYQQEYKQDPTHLAKVLNEVNAERMRPDQPMPRQPKVFTDDYVGNAFSHVGQAMGSWMRDKMSNRQREELDTWGKQLGIIKNPPANPFRMARMDRHAALIELSIAAVKIENQDAPAAAILRQDASVKRQEAERLDPETPTDVALGILDYSLGKRLPKQEQHEQQIQNPFSRR